MSKTLSEQVAGLERQITEAWDIAEEWKLNSECHRKRVEELEAEREKLKADAVSDLIQRHFLESVIRNHEAEIAELRAGQGRWPEESDAEAG